MKRKRKTPKPRIPMPRPSQTHKDRKKADKKNACRTFRRNTCNPGE